MLMPCLNMYGKTQRHVSMLRDVIKCTYISLLGEKTVNVLIYHVMLELILMPLLLDNKHSFPTWKYITNPHRCDNILEEADAN
jgi:hypothetical protein